MSQPSNWRDALAQWLQDNPRTCPPELATLHEEFLRRFPRERIGQLTLEEYALGHEKSKESYCYWLEYETHMLGSVRGGVPSKWGVWCKFGTDEWKHNKGGYDYTSLEDAHEKIQLGLTNLLAAAELGDYKQMDDVGDEQLGRNRNSLRSKTAYLYYPDRFLPIAKPDHLLNFLKVFELKPLPRVHARNHQLLTHLRSLSEFDGFDTLQMMRFLYDSELHKTAVLLFKNKAVLAEAIAAFTRFQDSPLYKTSEYNCKHELLYALESILNSLPEQEPAETVALLQRWFERYRRDIHKLTRKRLARLFEKYLQIVPAEKVQDRLAALVDEEADIKERIDVFREHFTLDYQTYAEKGEKEMTLSFISLLLMGSQPDNHFIYQESMIDKACEDWGADRLQPRHRQDGLRYTRYLSLVLPLKSQLLRQPADLIDVHSLLQFNDTDTYNQFKQQATDEKPVMDTPPFLKQLLEMTKRTRNLILYGPPGTGKTYWANQLRHTGNFSPDCTEFVTFHQSYAYEDFVEGLKPAIEKGQLRYTVKKGVFRRLCKRAKANPERDFLLIIDEINRANIAQVFGELITLLEDDKRAGEPNSLEVTLPYSGKRFSVPPNLYVIGTMNTADRSIALLDLALRRRFTFLEVVPNPQLLNQTIEGIPLADLLAYLNRQISRLMDRDHQLGHSYLLSVQSVEELTFAWNHQIVPLLQEYFHNQGGQLREILGDAFVTVEDEDGGALAYGANGQQYQINSLVGEDFLTALRGLAAVDA